MIPPEYHLDRDKILLYRRVSTPEFESWRAAGRLLPRRGGMALGKHFTASPELARRWGEAFVAAGWETEPGRVLEVRLDSAHVPDVHFDPMADGIGPQCFVPLSLLENADISEV
jgi:hypothetical protein